MDFNYFSIFLIGIIIIFLMGWLGFLPFISTERNRRWLMQYGTPVVAMIEHIHNHCPTRKREEKWQLQASWRDPQSGIIYHFRSNLLAFNPSEYLSNGTVVVLIDPNNPKKYFMDDADWRAMAGS